jgi:hypothetical protein
VAASTLGQALLAAGDADAAAAALREAQQLYAERQKIRTPDRIDVDDALRRATAAASHSSTPATVSTTSTSTSTSTSTRADAAAMAASAPIEVAVPPVR